MEPTRRRKGDAGGRVLRLVVRLITAACLLVAFGVFVLVALVAPEAGATPTSLRQGVLLAAVFAAPPVAVFVSRVEAASLVALGGGMTVAGAATSMGGNFLGPIMLVSGVPLLVVGGLQSPSLTPGLIGRLVFYAIALLAGEWLATGTGTLTGLAALLVASVVAISARWSTFGPPG